jgi:selenoprotein W-related protein
VSLVNELMTTYKRKVGAFHLTPSDKGRFEVTVDGELLYSKLATGKFPVNAEIVRAVGERLSVRK